MFGEVSLVMFLVVAAFGGVALLIWKNVPRSDTDNVSIGSISSWSRSGIFSSRNRDRFSDQSSVYSITLSERHEGADRRSDDADNTSEA